jgi:hypothetical protein
MASAALVDMRLAIHQHGGMNGKYSRVIGFVIGEKR